MNAASDTLLHRAEEKVETPRQEKDAESNGALVDLGKVSDTKGGWIGRKQDTGYGVWTY